MAYILLWGGVTSFYLHSLPPCWNLIVYVTPAKENHSIVTSGTLSQFRQTVCWTHGLETTCVSL